MWSWTHFPEVQNFSVKQLLFISLLFIFQLKGEVDDCSCKVESVDSFNNKKIHPILNSLLHKDYFRYFKASLLFFF